MSPNPYQPGDEETAKKYFDEYEMEPHEKKSLKEIRKKLDNRDYKSLEEIEAYFIAKTLRETQGNRATAAEILRPPGGDERRRISRTPYFRMASGPVTDLIFSSICFAVQ